MKMLPLRVRGLLQSVQIFELKIARKEQVGPIWRSHPRHRFLADVVEIACWSQVREPDRIVDPGIRKVTSVKCVSLYRAPGANYYFAALKYASVVHANFEIHLAVFKNCFCEEIPSLWRPARFIDTFNKSSNISHDSDAGDYFPCGSRWSDLVQAGVECENSRGMSFERSAAPQRRNSPFDQVIRGAECVVVLHIISQKVHCLHGELAVRSLSDRLEYRDTGRHVSSFPTFRDQLCTSLKQIREVVFVGSRNLERQSIDLLTLKVSSLQLGVCLALQNEPTPNDRAKSYDRAAEDTKWRRNLNPLKAGCVVGRNDNPDRSGNKTDKQNDRRGDSQALPRILALPSFSRKVSSSISRHRKSPRPQFIGGFGALAQSYEASL